MPNILGIWELSLFLARFLLAFEPQFFKCRSVGDVYVFTLLPLSSTGGVRALLVEQSLNLPLAEEAIAIWTLPRFYDEVVAQRTFKHSWQVIEAIANESRLADADLLLLHINYKYPSAVVWGFMSDIEPVGYHRRRWGLWLGYKRNLIKEWRTSRTTGAPIYSWVLKDDRTSTNKNYWAVVLCRSFSSGKPQQKDSFRCLCSIAALLLNWQRISKPTELNAQDIRFVARTHWHWIPNRQGT